MSAGPRAEKLNIESNNHGRTEKYDSFFFSLEMPWVNFAQKNRNCRLKLKFGT